MKAIQRTKKIVSASGFDNRFDELISSIIKKNTLLIVGKRFEIDHSTKENQELFDSFNLDDDADLYDLLLEQIKHEYSSDAIDFSELSEDSALSYKEGNILRKESIYSVISQAIVDCDLQPKDALAELRELIQTGYFRFVFTTSFSPIVEILMKEYWGEDNVRILNVFDKANQDIKDSQNDLLTPTVYYLFGKSGAKDRFVVTDNDALDILRRWQWDMRNSQIIEATANKHLLALGCDQDDWLFRFIWYTLKGSSNIANGSVSQYANDENLERYLRRNNILENKDARQFARSIITKLKEHDKEEELRTCPNKCDVFISYSRKDGDVADALYNELTSKGVSVWYDKYNLGGKGGEFMEQIYQAIDSCKMFVPILTPTIHEQRRDENGHPYRLEWKHALKRVGIHGWNDCIPVFDVEYDIYKAVEDDLVPREFREFTKLDAYGFNRYTLDFNRLSSNIQNIITK